MRAEYVNPYISTLRQFGVPVERELRRARLPTLIEEMSDEYISTHLIYKCVMNCIRAEGIEDLGFDVGWRLTFDDFSSEMKQALNSAPTLKYAIESLARLSPIEDSAVQCALLCQGETARIMVHQEVPADADRRLSDWPNIRMVIETIRRHTGPQWLPALIGLPGRLPVSSRIRQSLGETSVLTGQPFCYVGIPLPSLAALRQGPPRRRNPEASEADPSGTCLHVSDLVQPVLTTTNSRRVRRTGLEA